MTKDERFLLEEKYDGKETLEFEKDKARLAKGEPVAYVIGFQPFLGLKIHLDSHPLIPRPETEWWTEKMLNTKGAGHSQLLDLCAGTGAIGCALLKEFPSAQVYFGEVDPRHETTIRKNISENKLDESRADIRIGNLFEPFGELQFDVIATNPPYIPDDRALEESVEKWEPKEALRAGNDGLSLIRKIAEELPSHLKPNGIAWIECDSTHIEAAKALFVAQGFDAQILNDQYKVPRVVVVHPVR